MVYKNKVKIEVRFIYGILYLGGLLRILSCEDSGEKFLLFLTLMYKGASGKHTLHPIKHYYLTRKGKYEILTVPKTSNHQKDCLNNERNKVIPWQRL